MEEMRHPCETVFDQSHCSEPSPAEGAHQRYPPWVGERRGSNQCQVPKNSTDNNFSYFSVPMGYPDPKMFKALVQDGGDLRVTYTHPASYFKSSLDFL